MTFSNCSDTTVPVYYLGRVGDLQAIRMPPEGYSRLPNNHTVIHSLLEGQVMDRSSREQRTWVIDPNHLARDDWNALEELRTGARGLGPYVFIDPATDNYFTPNIASGTDVMLTSEGFVVTGTGETIASQSNVYHRGSRALGWTLSPAPTGTSTSLAMTTSYSPSGWATPPGQAWSMTGMLNSNGDFDPVFDGFESGAGSWLVSFGTISQSAAQAHSGSNSGLMTTNGAPSETFAYRTAPAVPGKSYTVGVWTRANSQQNNVVAEINFQDLATASVGSARSPLVMASNVVLDPFSPRTAASGWGTSSSGHAWTVSGGSSANYSVSSGTGRVSVTSLNVARTATVTSGGNDQVVSLDIISPVTAAATQPIRWRITGRQTDANNYYYAELELATDGNMRLVLAKKVAGGESLITAASGAIANTSGNIWRVTLSVIGTALTVTARNISTSSTTLTASNTDNALTTGKQSMVYVIFVTGNTNTLPMTCQFDNFSVDTTASPVGVWEFRTVTATAPANAATVLYGAANTLIPPNGETLYIDDVTFSTTTANTTITPQLAWINSSGGVISVTSGTSLIASAANGWQTFSVSGSAPVNAVYVQPRMQLSPIVAISSPTIYLDTLMLDMRSVARSWVVGQGQPRVALESTREVVSRIGRLNLSYKMYEVSV